MTWLNSDDPPKKRNTEPGRLKIMGYTISYIRFNLGSFLLNILTIGIAGISILVFGYLALCGYQEAVKNLDSSQAKKIIVNPRSDERYEESKRFTAEKIKEIKKLPWVSNAFERVCQNVYLSIGGTDPKICYIEGTTADDPEMDSSAMEWGNRVSTNNAEEIIVTSALLDELTHPATGQKTSSQRPDTIRVTVRRSNGNNDGELNREYHLVGVLNGKTKKAFISLQQVKHLEMWCSGKIDGIPENGSKIPEPEIAIKSGRLYISNEVSAEVIDQAQKHFKIELKKLSTQREPILGEIGQLRITQKDNLPFSTDEISKLKESLPEDVNVFTGNQIKANFRLEEREIKDAILQAFPANDPRLKNIKMMDGNDVTKAISDPCAVIVSQKFADRYLPYKSENSPDLTIEGESTTPQLRIVGVSENFIGNDPFDVLCSTDTFAGISQ